MKAVHQRAASLAAIACLVAGTVGAQDAGLSGAWDIVATFDQGRSAATMTLDLAGGAVTGSSGPLDEAGFLPLSLRGQHRGPRAEIEFLFGDEVVGDAVLTRSGGGLEGKGRLYGVAVTLKATRPGGAPREPATHEFVPTSWTVQYSARTAPVLRIRPGDRVRTTTLDNLGRDKDSRWRWMPGNTLTGPFYVEGAMPGDTLVVHLERVRLNRDTAEMYSGALNPKAVQGGYAQDPTRGWSRTWKLDHARGVARPVAAGERLGGLEVPLRPMVGSIGVAPPLNQTLFAGDLGFHGGNLDYPRLTEGATLYLPVFQAGALLSLGDGHALQGDGEVTGQGLETSLDVAFRVEVIRGRSLGQVWMEDDEDVMVSGIDNSLDAALQMATTGMARWLKERYGLTDSEVATLLGAALRYDIAEVVDARPHVVARLSKRTLAMIRAKPAG